MFDFNAIVKLRRPVGSPVIRITVERAYIPVFSNRGVRGCFLFCPQGILFLSAENFFFVSRYFSNREHKFYCSQTGKPPRTNGENRKKGKPFWKHKEDYRPETRIFAEEIKA